MAKGLPGYPSAKQINRQALALARAAVPTKRSIQRPYQQALGDTTSFTAALIHLLGQSQPGAGYDAAITQQQGIDQAAAARLQALGGAYGAGSAAAVGGLGDSALSSLVARGAAAKSYGAQLPAVAGARGQLFQQGLIHDQQTALQNRADALRSAFTQSLDQVQQQALARSTALASIRQNNRAFGEQQREFNANQAFQQAQFGEQKREFNFEHSPQWLGMQAQISAAASGDSSAAGPLAQYTPGQISGFQKQAVTALGADGSGLVAAGGQTPGRVVRNLIAAGIPRQIAVAEAVNAFRNLQPPPIAAKKTHPDQYQAALRAYQKVSRAFRIWIANRGWRIKHPNSAPSSNQPVSFGGGPH